MNGVKFALGSDLVIEGWAAPHGGVLNGRDLYGETFTKNTDFCLDWFTERPLLYHHGLDAETGTAVVGRVKAWEHKSKGLWVQAQLDANSEYVGALKELIGNDALYFSTGAMAHLVEVEKKSGQIKTWPWVELSLTPTPANILATVAEVETVTKHYKSAGLDADALRAKLTAAERDKLPDSDFAYIDSEGGRHLPIHDAEHVRAALSRFAETSFESDEAKEAAHKKILGAAEKFGVEVADGDADDAAKKSAPDAVKKAAPLTMDGCYEDLIEDLRSAINQTGPLASYVYNCLLATFPDDVLVCRHDYSDDGPGDQTYWKIPYTLGSDGQPMVDMSKATQLDQVYVPHGSKAAPAALSLDAHSLARHAAALVERTQDLHERRTKEGRVLSQANRQLIGEAVSTLGEASKALQTLLETSEQLQQEAAKAAALSSPEALRRQVELLSLFAQTV